MGTPERAARPSAGLPVVLLRRYAPLLAVLLGLALLVSGFPSRHTVTAAAGGSDLVDGSGPDPWGDLATVRREVTEYSPELARRPALVVVNKLDLAGQPFHAMVAYAELTEVLDRGEKIF